MSAHALPIAATAERLADVGPWCVRLTVAALRFDMVLTPETARALGHALLAASRDAERNARADRYARPGDDPDAG
jgi:hypothetical protein